ncbi:MAG TPA: hypothetical protein VGO58_18730 [Chitinophagaceae bacterium]|jgi:hypothetical protein|nr:hypothetical protein [Chitinophagaceae bacterium]
MQTEFTLIFIEDFYKVPFSLLLIYVFAFRVKAKYKYKDQLIEKYFITGLSFRLIATFVYTLVISYYYQGGDTGGFYQALKDIQLAVNNNFSILSQVYTEIKLDRTSELAAYFEYDGFGITHLYMYHVSNYMVPRFGLPFSFLFGQSYLCISFCCSLFAFGGCWRIFKLFYSLFPHLHKKIAVATLFLPSLLFWSSALMKDSITMGALGFFIYGFYQLFFQKKKILINIIIVTLSAFLLFYVKPYIILCAVPAFLVWAYLLLNRNIKDKGFRMFATVIFTACTLAGSAFFMQKIASSEVASQYATQNILKAVESQQNTYSYSPDAGSTFKALEFDNSVGGILKLFPLGIINSLFRPFPWEVRSPIMALTALEALLFLWLTIACIRHTSFKNFRQVLSNNPSIVFCFMYSILFAGLVGMSTLNFGTLARYKIPALPFFLIMLFVILDKTGKASPDIILHKKIF